RHAALNVLSLEDRVVPALATSYTLSGHVGAEVVAFPNQGTTAPSGGPPLATLPAGAAVDRAAFDGAEFCSSSSPTGSPSSTFAGTSLGTGSLISTLSGTFPVTGDPYTWRAFTWNVTSLVTGNGNYSAPGTGFSSPSLYGSYGMALVVVFSHP